MSEGFMNEDVRYAMRLYPASLNLTILFFKKGSFGTWDSVVQNFCPYFFCMNKGMLEY